MTPARSSYGMRSGCLQVGGGRLAAATIGLDVERQPLAFGQPGHAGALDRGNVHEHVRAAIILHDEAEALLGVEKLDGTLSHAALLFDKRNMRREALREPFARSSIRILRGLEKGPARKHVESFPFRVRASCYGARRQGRLNREWRVYREIG